MNLLSLKRELASLKALAFSRRDSLCSCEFVELVNGQALIPDQERILANNRTCYEQNHNREAHVGWSSILVSDMSYA
jgi:hypothetical protein